MDARAADAVVIGAGLAGLVAAAELLDAGRTVLILEQEPEASLGGQAWWSFGGIFLIDSPEQRRLGVRDSIELAHQDWFGSAGFNRADDAWPRRWAEAYLDFAAGEKRAWLQERGVGFFPVVGWAERGGDRASAHGNSVPRFHITWGTGPGVLEPFLRRVRDALADGTATISFRHRVDRLDTAAGELVGVSGSILAPDDAPRGAASNREVVGEFEVRAGAVLISSGGIGGNHDLVRAQWPARMGTPPASMLSGVPAHVDGRMLGIAEEAGARLINGDRMWHYTEGIQNHSPVWAKHGIRILPGPSSMWFDAIGRRLPSPLLPGFDTLATLRHLRTDPAIAQHDHSWFVLSQRIIEKEFALSGSEQNPDITNRDLGLLLRTRLGSGAPAPVEAFKRHGEDFVVADTIAELVAGMNGLTDEALLNPDEIARQVRERDSELANGFTKDAQVMAIHNARRYRGDRIMRVAKPHRILDPSAGPLIGVKLNILTRKSLGGLQTDLESRALTADGSVLPGLWAAGEAAGFGGGGVHGYNALEGTFLGGCLFSGRAAGRSMAG